MLTPTAIIGPQDAILLMTHPGIGLVTSLAFVLTIGPITRFPCSRKLVSYLGLNPSEQSSVGRRRVGAISKQANTLVRQLSLSRPAASSFDI